FDIKGELGAPILNLKLLFLLDLKNNIFSSSTLSSAVKSIFASRNFEKNRRGVMLGKKFSKSIFNKYFV
ncbi:hypothetical protein, partial [Salmonella sp. SAL4360]|uniref:hypothetical protein n=1 Tax=Salmonella sp. SAL4360 TaxID=3159881 RepID=UPI003978A626